MQTVAQWLALLVAAEHFYIMYLEMCRIPSQQAARMFRMPEDFLQQPRVRVLFSNQGLYNGFLAVGIVWAQLGASSDSSSDVTRLFLLFVLSAAVWGAYSSGNRGILWKQGLPAAVALLAGLLAAA